MQCIMGVQPSTIDTEYVEQKMTTVAAIIYRKLAFTASVGLPLPRTRILTRKQISAGVADTYENHF